MIETFKKKNVVIGVHIRRGDYKFAYNGKYYFEFEDYVDILKKIQNSYATELRFILVSNETIPIARFNELDCTILNSDSPSEDNYILSKCDLIIGPPSTFSAWAALVGNKKICFIESKDQVISKSSFFCIKEKWEWI